MAVGEVELAPEAASIGLDVCVVSQDGKRKVSILGSRLSVKAGAITRLDGDAPKSGDDTFNDFNTFYLQAEADTKARSC